MTRVSHGASSSSPSDAPANRSSGENVTKPAIAPEIITRFRQKGPVKPRHIPNIPSVKSEGLRVHEVVAYLP